MLPWRCQLVAVAGRGKRREWNTCASQVSVHLRRGGLGRGAVCLLPVVGAVQAHGRAGMADRPLDQVRVNLGLPLQADRTVTTRLGRARPGAGGGGSACCALCPSTDANLGRIAALKHPLSRLTSLAASAATWCGWPSRRATGPDDTERIPQP